MLLLDELTTKLNEKKVIALTGEHISVLSGIPSAREKIYKELSVNDIFSLNFLKTEPLIFFKAYFNMLFKTQLKNPSYIHGFLKSLEIPVITQSYDGLHLKAGTETIELHGNINYFRCHYCDHIQKAYIPNSNVTQCLDSLIAELTCPVCKSGLLRPDVILEGEELLLFHEALNKLFESDILLVIGDQNDIWPANKLLKIAQKNSINIITIEESQYPYLMLNQ
ncbi:NAD-dependent SIR2 family protein deacetylase [Paenibacillus shirakamiensis]|uniref:protein acetyllysine N-acetyltransferase n=1 Tax=Paenibacillus shirakamiensis TaxID=1265935 RepID=A0ABS4JN00_9BACL|nr:Sir2 family NAD-dependent protein deacetylase [Paenibacillus shirakamiensis]MBP2002391.1 NAD-dependent SIR2 family protein deacetylase [Paenibacillus shirakamiensis]